MKTASDMPETRPGQDLRRVSARLPLAGPRTIFALMLREMASSNGRVAGGYLWTVLQPILAIIVLSAITSLGFRNPRLGTNFAIFYATGMMPFAFALTVSDKMAGAIGYSKALLGYPRVTFTDVIAARLLLHVLTQSLVAGIGITFIRVMWDTRTILDLPAVMLTYAMALVLGAGVGALNCFLFAMFPLWERGWPVLSRPLFFISGVLILYDSFPEPYRSWVWYNPLMQITSKMRAAFYYGYEANYVSPAYVFGFGMVPLVLGLLLLRRYHRDIREM